MGRIMLATSNSTDEEYGGNIKEISQEITLTSTKSSGFDSAAHFVKNGVAYLATSFTPSENIAPGNVGNINVTPSTDALWIGQDVTTGTLVRGYIARNTTTLVSAVALTANHIITIFSTFEIVE